MSFTHIQELAPGRPVPTSEHSPNGLRQADTDEEKNPQAKKRKISDSEHRERETETRQEKEIRLTGEYFFTWLPLPQTSWGALPGWQEDR